MTEERILDFLDGNLDASAEEELLHRLAVSPERRNLLRQHLQMRELTASLARRQYVPVPKLVTASLFTTLAANGYAGPSMPATNESREAVMASLTRNVGATAENIVAKAPGVFRRSTLALASLASFIVGGALIYFVMPQSSQERSPISVTQQVQQVKPEMASVVNQLPSANTIQNISSKSIRQADRIPGRSSVVDIVNQTPMVSEDVTINEQNIGVIPELPEKNADLAAIIPTQSKYEGVQTSADIVGGNSRSRNPFDPMAYEEEVDQSFWHRITLSLRAGEGKSPGNSQALTGSLIEIKASADITDWFVAKISVGQFMPYEMEALEAHPGFNSDGIRLLQLSPVVQYRYIVGAELGAKFPMFSTPFEFTA